MNEENETTAVGGQDKIADLTIKSKEVAEQAKTAAKKPAKGKKVEPIKPEKPNLQFVGKHPRWNKKANRQEKVLRESPAFVIDGREKIKLPRDLHKKAAAVDAETAARVKSLFPSDFKTPVAK